VFAPRQFSSYPEKYQATGLALVNFAYSLTRPVIYTFVMCKRRSDQESPNMRGMNVFGAQRCRRCVEEDAGQGWFAREL